MVHANRRCTKMHWPPLTVQPSTSPASISRCENVLGESWVLMTQAYDPDQTRAARMDCLQFECDTFFPAIDPKRFRLWSASEPREEKGTR